MYHVLAQVDAPPEHRDELISLWRDLAADCVRTEPGTLVFEFFQDEGNPNRFYFHETYTDAAAFQSHMQGAVVQRLAPRIRLLTGGQFSFLGRGSDVGATEA